MSLTEMLQIKYPILQGAMAQIATYELASAVSNAGGLGIIASGGMSADTLREQIRLCKEKNNETFRCKYHADDAKLPRTCRCHY